MLFYIFLFIQIDDGKISQKQVSFQIKKRFQIQVFEEASNQFEIFLVFAQHHNWPFVRCSQNKQDIVLYVCKMKVYNT